MSDNARNPALDWIRAISILYVTGFWHLNDYDTVVTWYHAAPLYRLAVLALALFVLISGYLASRSLREASWSAAKAYYINRLLRLYPPYLLALALFAILGLAGGYSVIKGALLIAMLVPRAPPTLWFMTMIVLFYVAAPLLASRIRAPSYIIIASSIAWILLLLLSTEVHQIDQRLLIYLPVFVAGFLLAKTSRRLSPYPWLAAALLGLIVSFETNGDFSDRSLWMAPWALTGAVAVFLLADRRLPRSRIIQELSYGSFFLYLFHRVIYKVALSLLPLSVAERTVVLIFIAFPISVLAGIFGQRAYDNYTDFRARPRSA